MINIQFIKNSILYLFFQKRSNTMEKVTEISDFYIQKGIDDGNLISQLKLQKIVYIFHGFYLAINETPYFDEKIQAWKFGPVIPSLYKKYNLYGNSNIDNSLSFIIGEPKVKKFSETELDLLNQIWDITKNLSAIQLVNWTHSTDGPWYKYYNQYNRDIEIPNDEIKSYFKNFIKNED